MEFTCEKVDGGDQHAEKAAAEKTIFGAQKTERKRTNSSIPLKVKQKPSTYQRTRNLSESVKKTEKMDEVLNLNKDCLLKIENSSNLDNTYEQLKLVLLKNQESLNKLVANEDKMANVKQLQDELEKEKIKANYFKENMKKNDEDKQNFEKTIDKLQAQISTLEEELKVQKSSACEIKKRYQGMKIKLKDAEKRAKDSEDKFQQLTESLGRKEEENTKLKDEFKKKEGILQKRITDKQKQFELATLEHTNEIAKMQSEFEAKVKDYQDKIMELMKQNQQLLDEQQTLINKNQELSKNMESLSGDKQKEIESLQAELQTLVQMNNELEIDKKNSTKCIEELRNLLKSMRDEIAYKNDKIHEILKKVLAKEEELNNWKKSWNETYDSKIFANLRHQ